MMYSEDILYNFILRNYCSSGITLEEYYSVFTHALENMMGGNFYFEQRDRRFVFLDNETGFCITGTPELLYCVYGIHEIVVRTQSTIYKFSFEDFYKYAIPHRRKELINENFKHHFV